MLYTCHFFSYLSLRENKISSCATFWSCLLSCRLHSTQMIWSNFCVKLHLSGFTHSTDRKGNQNLLNTRWQWRNFDTVPYLCQLISATILQVKPREMSVTVMELRYALLASLWSYGHFLNELVQFYLNNMIDLPRLTPHIMLCYTHKMAIVSCSCKSGLKD